MFQHLANINNWSFRLNVGMKTYPTYPGMIVAVLFIRFGDIALWATILLMYTRTLRVCNTIVHLSESGVALSKVKTLPPFLIKTRQVS